MLFLDQYTFRQYRGHSLFCWHSSKVHSFLPRLPIRSKTKLCPDMASYKKRGSDDYIGNWAFSGWAFCCHMWALHELSHNIPNYAKMISKMIISGMAWHFGRNISPSRRRCRKKDDLAFSEKHFLFTKKMWESMLRLKGPTFAVLC